MKQFIDGDQLCIVPDSFVNLHESPAVFVDLNGDFAQTIVTEEWESFPISYSLKRGKK